MRSLPVSQPFFYVYVLTASCLTVIIFMRALTFSVQRYTAHSLNVINTQVKVYSIFYLFTLLMRFRCLVFFFLLLSFSPSSHIIIIILDHMVRANESELKS